MSHTVIGIFKKSSDAQDAVESLQDAGFTSSQIDIAVKNNDTTGSPYHKTEESSENGIERFFKSIFGGDEADTYSTAAGRNESVVTVHATSVEDANNAVDILDGHGAVDAHEEAAGESDSFNRNTTRGDSTGDTNRGSFSASDRDANSPDSLKVIREDLEVGKREVETGGVRLRSRIVERPVEENVRLRTEHVTVNRTPVNREATEADFNAFKEGEVEMRETKEVPLVSKTARIVEEVSLDKEVSEHTDTVRETLRNTEVDVEKIPGKENNTNSDFNRTGAGTEYHSDSTHNRSASDYNSDSDQDRNTSGTDYNSTDSERTPGTGLGI